VKDLHFLPPLRKPKKKLSLFVAADSDLVASFQHAVSAA